MSPLKELPRSLHHINISILRRRRKWTMAKIIMLGAKTAPGQMQPPLLKKTASQLCKFRTPEGNPCSHKGPLKGPKCGVQPTRRDSVTGKTTSSLGAGHGKENMGSGDALAKRSMCPLEGNPLMTHHTHAINLDLWPIIWNEEAVTKPH